MISYIPLYSAEDADNSEYCDVARKFIDTKDTLESGIYTCDQLRQKRESSDHYEEIYGIVFEIMDCKYVMIE